MTDQFKLTKSRVLCLGDSKKVEHTFLWQNTENNCLIIEKQLRRLFDDN